MKVPNLALGHDLHVLGSCCLDFEGVGLDLLIGREVITDLKNNKEKERNDQKNELIVPTTQSDSKLSLQRRKRTTRIYTMFQ